MINIWISQEDKTGELIFAVNDENVKGQPCHLNNAILRRYLLRNMKHICGTCVLEKPGCRYKRRYAVLSEAATLQVVQKEQAWVLCVMGTVNTVIRKNWFGSVRLYIVVFTVCAMK